ncbi:MAG TPA: helix-turn-helix transcriptional regulator [Burkholderiales bacterium]|nr:helix-turn-helix transcriptional regulator [Burkholderiales bacterium]
MAQTAALVEVLKRELKVRGVTYAHVARRLNLSEASVKRMFSKRDFTLKRLDQICQLTQVEFSDLARILEREEDLISQLSWEQEQEIVSDRKLFLVAVCALNHVTFEQIVAAYDLSRAECIQLLARLDRLGFIQLQPNNRIKLLVSHNFSWLPDGPIQRFFNQQAHSEYFRSRFARPHEYMVVVNGMLSRTSSAAIVSRLKRVAREFSELHSDDSRLPLAGRSSMSLLVAIRHWELHAFAELRRRKTPQPRILGPAAKGGGVRRRRDPRLAPQTAAQEGN